ncbi:type III secretion protein U [Mitsuaria sp. BK045]|uniref:type III secretion system export apparatus subunit SctU n=1 Tax=unclassified Roseateles TaxID=2626991 RepID=UPI00161796FF|nr:MULTISPECIES: type III secretion system export apparatus subunit SctU [unclassified Roseateles]MBB3293793.1 type III secretion protein U [Mitsuaria sp. BK041]MBB3363010.1 type III secretion protein U [Mitsuaria sp. BK045]
MSGEKTEEPTKKKLDDARKKGQSPKSQDVNAALGLVGLLIVLIVMAESTLDQLSGLIVRALREGVVAKSNEELLALTVDITRSGFLATLPFVAVSVALGVIASFAQVGFNLSFEPLNLQFDKLNPAEGVKKLFSVRSIIDFLKMVAKAIALGAVLWVMIRGLVPLLVGAAYFDAVGVGVLGWKALIKLISAGCLVFIIVGPVDFGLQLWLFKRDQKMSKDEIKREHKESEGDPQLKGKRKEIAHEMATSPPEQRVPGSTVVVTNPTHYAVALRYEPGETPLPVIVAKGMDAEALRIRAIAEKSGVPIVGNPPLARALHKLPVDDAIPEELFEAVAAVLRWVAYLHTLTSPAPLPASVASGAPGASTAPAASSTEPPRPAAPPPTP